MPMNGSRYDPGTWVTYRPGTWVSLQAMARDQVTAVEGKQRVGGLAATDRVTSGEIARISA